MGDPLRITERLDVQCSAVEKDEVGGMPYEPPPKKVTGGTMKKKREPCELCEKEPWVFEVESENDPPEPIQTCLTCHDAPLKARVKELEKENGMLKEAPGAKTAIRSIEILEARVKELEDEAKIRFDALMECAKDGKDSTYYRAMGGTWALHSSGLISVEDFQDARDKLKEMHPEKCAKRETMVFDMKSGELSIETE